MSDGAERTSQLTALQRALLGIRELRAQLDEAERARNEPIAVIGMGLRLPGGANDPESFWQLLHDGADVIQPMPADRWDVDAYFDADPEAPGKMSTRWGGFVDGIDQFDPAYFGISPWEASNMDPQQRLMLEVVQEAFDDAGQVREQLRGSRTGVFVGLAHSEYAWLNFNSPDLANVYTATGSFGSIVANRVSYLYDLRGPSYTMDAVCSSSLLAVHQACESLRSGDCTMAVAGGAGLFLKPEGFIWFTKLGVMAPDGRCKAFDARGDGIVLGEGVAAVVLKTLSRAQADHDPIYAVLRGSAVVQDGRSNGLTAPSRLSQEEMLRQAYERAGVDPADVQYVETHGTGTILGDPIEAQALGTILGARRDPAQPLMIGSVKTNIGHLQMVGGLAGMMKVVLAMKHRQLPASLHFTAANPHIPFDEYRLRVQEKRAPWPYPGPMVAGVTSLSFGGTNVHMVVEEAPWSADPPARTSDDQRARLLPLSAQDPAALRDLAGVIREFSADPSVDLDDLCYTASLRRTHYDDRLAVSFTSREDLADRLAAFHSGAVRPGTATGDRSQHTRRQTVFVFPGQGGQWLGMGRRLLETEPVFQQAIQECAAAMRPHVSWSLADALRAGSPEQLDEIDVVQPMIWAVQVALAALWRSWGVAPDVVVGHSMGEVAAAYVAGALSLDDAARVICRRSALVRRIRGRGAMAVVELPMDQARAAIAGLDDRVAVAASNSPTTTVLSGDSAAIEAVIAALTEQEVFCRQVKVDFASHSPHVDELRDDLLAELRGVRPRASAVPILSTVTGQRTNGAEFTAEYWADNLREPVLFASAIEQLVGGAPSLVIEINPHPILLPSVEQTARHIGTTVTALPSLRRDEDERAVLLGTLGTLWTLGHRVDWHRQHADARTVLRLPRYPWQRQRHWLDFRPAAPLAAQAPSGERYFRAATPGEHFWELAVDRTTWPDLGGFAVLPSAALLELALTAALPLTGTPTVALTDVTFEDALPAAGPGRVAQLAATAVRGGSAEWQVFSSPVGAAAPSGPWTRHARGSMRVVSGSGQPYLTAEDTPAAIQQRCEVDLPGHAYRDSRIAAGLPDDLGARMVQRLWRRDGELLALLESSASDRESQLDWPLLHAAFGLLPMTAPDPAAAVAAWRPDGVERLRAHCRADGEIWAHVRLREIGADSLTGDVRLLDTQLRTVVEVTGLRLATGEHEAEAVADPGGAAEVVAVPASSRAVLLTIAPAERRPILTEYLREQISAVLGLQPTQLEVTQPLAALGLNSLMTFELRNRLRVMYGAAISPQEFLAGITVEQIAGHVLAQLDTPAAPAIPQAASTPRPVALRRPDPGRVSTDPADWLVRGIPDPHAALRLFCLPYAGGNASLYRTWVGEAFEGIPRIEVCPIQLPGREQRHQEPAYTQMSSLVHTLGSVLRPYLQAPYALFGHSMGGLIAYELTRWLRRQGDAAPAHLYVSAARAPHLPDLEPPLHRLPEPQLIAKLRSMGGTPQELLGDPELMALYLPVLRADFALVETRIHHTEPPLDLPLTVFGGTHDDKVGPQSLAAWQSHTTAKFSVEMLAGDHFYLQRDPAGVLAALSASLHDTFLSAGDSES